MLRFFFYFLVVHKIFVFCFLSQCPDMELKALREKIDPVTNEFVLENVYNT